MSALAGPQPPLVCDDNVDEAACTCDGEIAALGEPCDIVDMSNVPPLDDPSQVDTSEWLTSNQDLADGRWVVRADLTKHEGLGLFHAPENGGEWESEDQLNTYLSELLGVPLDSDGLLLPFRTEQAGGATVIDLPNNLMWDSSKTFWRALIGDAHGDVYIGGALLATDDEFVRPSFSCAPPSGAPFSPEPQADLDQGVSDSTKFTGRAKGFLCMSGTITYPDGRQKVSVRSSTTGDNLALRSLPSTVDISGNPWDCSAVGGNFDCDFSGAIESLGDEMFRFTRVRAAFDITHDVYKDYNFVRSVPQQEIAEASRVDDSDEAYDGEPPYNGACGYVEAGHVGSNEEWYADVAVYSALGYNGEPQCYLQELQEEQ